LFKSKENKSTVKENDETISVLPPSIPEVLKEPKVPDVSEDIEFKLVINTVSLKKLF